MIGGLLSAVGGAAQGFGGAIGDIMQQRGRDAQLRQQAGRDYMQQKDREAARQQQLDMAEASRAATAHNAQMNRNATAQYRADTLEGQQQQRSMMEAYYQRQTDNQSYRDTTARMREEREARADPALDERGERAMIATNAVARARANAPEFDPIEFASYQEYNDALATHERAVDNIRRTYGYENDEQMQSHLPGGSYLKPSNHTPAPPGAPGTGYGDLIARNQQFGGTDYADPAARAQWARPPEDELRSTIREEMRGRR